MFVFLASLACSVVFLVLWWSRSRKTSAWILLVRVRFLSALFGSATWTWLVFILTALASFCPESSSTSFSWPHIHHHHLFPLGALTHLNLQAYDFQMFSSFLCTHRSRPWSRTLLSLSSHLSTLSLPPFYWWRVLSCLTSSFSIFSPINAEQYGRCFTERLRKCFLIYCHGRPVTRKGKVLKKIMIK